MSALLPPDLVDKLYRSGFLFLGYGMSDWNLQVILHRIWGTQKIRARSWAVQPWVGEVNRLLWAERDVDLIEADLGGYVIEFEGRLSNRFGGQRID